MKKNILLLFLFSMFCSIQANKATQDSKEQVLTPEEKTEKFFNDIREKTVENGVGLYVLSELMFHQGGKWERYFRQDDSLSGKVCSGLSQTVQVASLLPDIWFFSLSLYHDIVSAALEKDSNFFMRLCRHLSEPDLSHLMSNLNSGTAKGRDALVDIGLLAIEEVSRKVLYKKIKDFYPDDDQKSKPAVHGLKALASGMNKDFFIDFSHIL